MSDDELRDNARVQALKPQVDTLEGHINGGTLGAQTLATLRTLRDAVQESIRLRTRLQSLGHDPGHAARIVVEQGFETAVVAEIGRQEAAAEAAARAAENARLAAGPPLLAATSTWGRRA